MSYFLSGRNAFQEPSPLIKFHVFVLQLLYPRSCVRSLRPNVSLLYAVEALIPPSVFITTARLPLQKRTTPAMWPRSVTTQPLTSSTSTDPRTTRNRRSLPLSHPMAQRMTTQGSHRLLTLCPVTGTFLPLVLANLRPTADPASILPLMSTFLSWLCLKQQAFLFPKRQKSCIKNSKGVMRNLRRTARPSLLLRCSTGSYS